MCLVHIVALFVGKTAEKDTGLLFIIFLKLCKEEKKTL